MQVTKNNFATNSLCVVMILLVGCAKDVAPDAEHTSQSDQQNLNDSIVTATPIVRQVNRGPQKTVDPREAEIVLQIPQEFQKRIFPREDSDFILRSYRVHLRCFSNTISCFQEGGFTKATFPVSDSERKMPVTSTQITYSESQNAVVESGKWNYAGTISIRNAPGDSYNLKLVTVVYGQKTDLCDDCFKAIKANVHWELSKRK